MEINTEKIRFQFHENYKDIIDNSSIVRDFDKFIEMAMDGLLELSKTNILSMSSTKLVNEIIIRKIPMQMKRPLIKSYPNVLALFILFSLSGLGKKEIKGKKRFLRVNTKMLEQWKQFTDVDKYFYLFSLTFTNFSFEPVNDGKSDFEFNIITKRLAEIKKKWIPDKYESERFFGMYIYKTIFMTLNMFGLIDIEDAPPIENQGWNIISIQPKSFMRDIWDIITKLKFNCSYPISDDDEEIDDDYSFTVDDIEEIGSTHRFADKITELIPDFTQRLTINMGNKSGTYYFKVNLGKAWRILKVDYRNSLDDLCYVILEAFDFDYDHLYDVTFLSSFGYSLTFHGAPEISYAEYPTTVDISIGILPIQINDGMIFTYDYGDNWKFTIILEQIEPIKNETNEIPDIEIIDIKGKAPDQYPRWE